MLNLWYPIILGLIALIEGIFCIRRASKVEDKRYDYKRYQDSKRELIKSRRRQAAAANPTLPALNGGQQNANAVQALQAKASRVKKKEIKAEEPKPNPNRLARAEEFFDVQRQE